MQKKKNKKKDQTKKRHKLIVTVFVLLSLFLSLTPDVKAYSAGQSTNYATLQNGKSAVGFSVVETPLVPDAVESLDAVEAEHYRHEVIFVDESVPDYQQLVDDLLAKHDHDCQADIVILDSIRDGIEQISHTLSTYRDLDAVHVISHGTEGAVQLGSSVLNSESLDEYDDDIEGWRDSLTAKADLLFYGCDLASGEQGRNLINSLTLLTGADVAASDDPTGHAKLGGDWVLEYNLGFIESSVVLDLDTQQIWHGLLATYTVRDQFNTASSFSGNNGTQNWTNDWQELGESDGAGSGKVQVRSSPAALRIGGSGTINGDGVSREADLSGAISATVTLDVWRSASRSASITLAVSDNGGTDWYNLQTWSFSSLTSTPATKTEDISDYIASDTQIRLLGSGEADSAYFYADNIQIEYSTPSYQPDAMIKLSSEGDGSYLTDDTYESTVSAQVKTQGVVSGSTAAYNIKFENDGNTTDSLVITGTATGSNFTVQYLDDVSTDRTAAVTGAGYTISGLAAGANKVWTLNVTPDGGGSPVAGGTSYDVTVTATSSNDGTKTDQVKATTSSTSANLTLLKSADKGTAVPGDEISYTVTATNGSGLTSASNVVITDEFDSNTGFKMSGASFNAGTSTLSLSSNDYRDSGGWGYTPVDGGCSAPTGYDYCVLEVKWTMSGTMPTNTNFSIGLVVIVK